MPLHVETGLNFGNAGNVAVREEHGTCRVSFTADPHGGPECLWFCLRVSADGGATGGRLELALENVTNLLGAGKPENFRPVCRTPDADWERLEAPRVEELPDGRRVAVWTVPAPQEWLELALCYPYGPADLEGLLAATNGHWRRDVIGVSQGGRPLERLSNRYGAAGGSQPGVYLIARQHSGETPGSWIMDGMLRAFAAAGAHAPLVWAVPFSNMDGVLQGDYGKDNFPCDLNRAWGRPPMRHETLVYTADMRRWKARCRPRLALDLHAPGASENDGIYAYLRDEGEQSALHAETSRWVQRLGQALTPEFAAEDFGRVAKYPSRWETPTFTQFAQTLECCALTFETPYAMARGALLTRERYQEAGRRLAAGVLEALAEEAGGRD